MMAERPCARVPVELGGEPANGEAAEPRPAQQAHADAAPAVMPMVLIVAAALVPWAAPGVPSVYLAAAAVMQERLPLAACALPSRQTIAA